MWRTRVIVLFVLALACYYTQDAFASSAGKTVMGPLTGRGQSEPPANCTSCECMPGGCSNYGRGSGLQGGLAQSGPPSNCTTCECMPGGCINYGRGSGVQGGLAQLGPPANCTACECMPEGC